MKRALYAALIGLMASGLTACNISQAPDYQTGSEVQGKNNNPRILPINSKPFGKTYGQWNAAWWQWALGQPVDTSPLLDSTGELCGVGQEGPVWFLAGTIVDGPAVRDCTIPVGRALFFPIANIFDFDNGPIEEMQAFNKAYMDATFHLSAEVDGIGVQNLRTYREASPVFELNLPENNLFEIPAGVYPNAVADGFYLMLAPLSRGLHTVHFHAVFPSGSELDVTYNLRVL